MGEGNVFSLFTPGGGGRGYPARSRLGGLPQPDPDGGEVPQGTSPTAKVGTPPTILTRLEGRGEGYPNVPTPLAKVGTTPPARLG